MHVKSLSQGLNVNLAQPRLEPGTVTVCLEPTGMTDDRGKRICAISI